MVKSIPTIILIEVLKFHLTPLMGIRSPSLLSMSSILDILYVAERNRKYFWKQAIVISKDGSPHYSKKKTLESVLRTMEMSCIPISRIIDKENIYFLELC